MAGASRGVAWRSPRAGPLDRVGQLAYFAAEFVTISLVGTRRPGRLLRRLFQLPAWLYRIGAGGLVSHSILLLTTTGRKSGQPGVTPLGYTYGPATDTYFVRAGWGEASDWVRNMRADPRVRVEVGSARLDGRAEQLPEDLAIRVLEHYNRMNPFAARLWPRLTGVPFDGSEAGLREIVARCPIIALWPSREGAQARS